MPVIDRTHVWISRIGPPLPRRVRHHHLRLRTNVRVALAQGDSIPITLRHLPPVQPGHLWRESQLHLGLLQYGRKFDHVGYSPGLETLDGIIKPYFQYAHPHARGKFGPLLRTQGEIEYGECVPRDSQGQMEVSAKPRCALASQRVIQFKSIE